MFDTRITRFTGVWSLQGQPFVFHRCQFELFFILIWANKQSSLEEEGQGLRCWWMALFASPEIGLELKSVSAGVTDGAQANRSANTSSVMRLRFDSLPIFFLSLSTCPMQLSANSLWLSQLAQTTIFSHIQTPTCVTRISQEHVHSWKKSSQII